jgi:hypothetical protein
MSHEFPNPLFNIFYKVTFPCYLVLVETCDLLYQIVPATPVCNVIPLDTPIIITIDVLSYGPGNLIGDLNMLFIFISGFSAFV